MSLHARSLPASTPRLRFSSSAIGWWAMTGTILAASTYYSFAKILTSALSPLSLVLLSESLTALFVLVSFGFLPAVKTFLRLSRRKKLALLGVGLSSGISAPALLFTGLKTTSAVNATLFGNTETLFLMILAVVLLGERVGIRHIIAKAVILVGIACIAFRGFTEGFTLYPGDILLLLSSLFFSLGDLIFRKELHHVHTFTVVLSRSVLSISGVLLLSVLMPSGGIFAEITSFPLSLAGVLLGFAFVSRFLNIFCFYQALERLPVGTLAVFSNLTVVSSIAFARLFLGERIEGYQFAGALFVISGAVFLEVLGFRRHARAEDIPQLQQRHVHRT